MLPDTVLIIIPTIAGDRLRSQQWALDKTGRDFLIAYPGTLIAGRRFSRVIVTAEAAAEIDAEERAAQWFDDCVGCRLAKDGAVCWL